MLLWRLVQYSACVHSSLWCTWRCDTWMSPLDAPWKRPIFPIWSHFFSTWDRRRKCKIRTSLLRLSHPIPIAFRICLIQQQRFLRENLNPNYGQNRPRKSWAYGLGTYWYLFVCVVVCSTVFIFRLLCFTDCLIWFKGLTFNADFPHLFHFNLTCISHSTSSISFIWLWSLPSAAFALCLFSFVCSIRIIDSDDLHSTPRPASSCPSPSHLSVARRSFYSLNVATTFGNLFCIDASASTCTPWNFMKFP